LLELCRQRHLKQELEAISNNRASGIEGKYFDILCDSDSRATLPTRLISRITVDLRLRLQGNAKIDMLLAGSEVSASTAVAKPMISGDIEITNRVRTPYSSGFLFTVQPEYKQKGENGDMACLHTECECHKLLFIGELKSEGKSAAGSGNRSDNVGETRQRLLKIMRENKQTAAKSRFAGKKLNPRAETMSLSGRNKA
jgi:hypothetical protein